MNRNMVTAVSNVNKLASTKYVATGAADGSVCLIDMDNCSQVFTAKVSISIQYSIGIQEPCCYH